MKKTKQLIALLIVILAAVIYSYGVWPRPIYNTNVGSGSYLNTGAIDEDTEYIQKFVCEDVGLCGLNIKLTKMDNPTIGTYEWSVVDAKSNQVVGMGIIDQTSTENKVFESASAQKKGIVELEFNKQTDSKGKEYILSIKAIEVEEGETMAVYVTEKNQNETELSINGKKLEQTSVIKLNYQRFNLETFIVFLGIMIYLILFVKFMYKLFR